MGWKDFVSKTASDALGRIIANAPSKSLALLTSLLQVRIEIDSAIVYALDHYLDLVGTTFWYPVSSYGTSPSDRVRPGNLNDFYDLTIYRNSRLAIVRHRPILLSAATKDKDCRWYLTVPRGFDVEGLIREALKNTPKTQYPTKIRYEAEGTQRILSRLTDPGPLWRSPAYSCLEADLTAWWDAAPKYEAMNIPWRRGWLLHGPPGNGKTLAILALAHSKGLCVQTMSMQMTDAAFTDAVRRCQRPGFILLEDVDDVIRGRTNIRDSEHGIAFSTLLSILDSTSSQDGLVYVVTTNDLSAIDPALGKPRDESGWNQPSTRPGRLDLCVRFDNPDEAGRYEIGKLYLSDAEARDLARKHVDVSIAQHVALCRDAAFTKTQELNTSG